MPSLKDIKLRIKSVITTQKTTRAMKMVSAAKLRKAQDNLLRLRPYANKMNELLGRLVAATEGSDMASEYATERQPERVLVLLVTSNRGLAGAFNNALCKMAQATLEQHYAAQHRAGNLQILALGKKGYDYFNKRGYKMVGGHSHDVYSPVEYATIEAIAAQAMQQFVAGEYDRVLLVYNEFKNMMTQNRMLTQWLPIQKPVADGKVKAVDYIYEPAKEEILQALIPRILKMRVYRAVLESFMGEHAARMMAMDAATENADDLLGALRLTYNKARQAAITKEILEIVGGAEALKG